VEFFDLAKYKYSATFIIFDNIFPEKHPRFLEKRGSIFVEE
jgi:hypothetical protein